MKLNIEKTPAYQGRGWKSRMTDARGVWAPHAVNSEWAPLKAVVLYCPRGELRKIRSPLAVQHLHPIAINQLQRQMRRLASVYRRFGVRVIEVDPSRLPSGLRNVPPNLMFVRDLFFHTAEGAVIARMASRVRAGEEKFVSVALAEQGVMVRGSIAGRGLFEGADALWLSPKLVVVGVGSRTNAEGFRQLRSLVSSQGIECVAVPMPKGIQHLLGFLQIVDRNLAVVRTGKAPASLMRLLKKRKFRVIAVEESDEVREKLGFNFVALKARTVIMPAGCPALKSQLIQSGIKVAAEVDVSQMCNAAGGIGCVTGILSRKAVR